MAKCGVQIWAGISSAAVTGIQRQLQQVPAVQPQDGTAVGADVANGLQPGRELIRRLQGGQKNAQLCTLRVFP